MSFIDPFSRAPNNTRAGISNPRSQPPLQVSKFGGFHIKDKLKEKQLAKTTFNITV